MVRLKDIDKDEYIFSYKDDKIFILDRYNFKLMTYRSEALYEIAYRKESHSLIIYPDDTIYISITTTNNVEVKIGQIHSNTIYKKEWGLFYLSLQGNKKRLYSLLRYVGKRYKDKFDEKDIYKITRHKDWGTVFNMIISTMLESADLRLVTDEEEIEIARMEYALQ